MGSPVQNESLNNYDNILHMKIRLAGSLKAFEKINLPTAMA